MPFSSTSLALRSLIALAIVASVASARAADGRVYDEARVKAEFVERFCRFVDWPDEAFVTPAAPFVIAVLGKDPVGAALRDVAGHHTVKGRRVVLLESASVAEAAGAHVVWVSGEGLIDLDALLDRTHGRPVLTVAGAPGAAERGVLINLRRDGPYVRFDINLSEVQASGLRFSSKLLRLGDIVGPDAGVPR